MIHSYIYVCAVKDEKNNKQSESYLYNTVLFNKWEKLFLSQYTEILLLTSFMSKVFKVKTSCESMNDSMFAKFPIAIHKFIFE